ncbi:MAG TPA: PH domain-containing protein [Candidatus Polarisedimenticolaceae bacterium]|nr:PH domain-containing protein [Candidatus Polarisedimenticolaceae bacterium]
MSKLAKSKRTTEFPGQHPDEEVVLVFRQHPVVMRKQLIYGMLAILVGLIPLVIWPLSDVALKIFLITPVLVLVYWFYHWIGWFYSVYIVTDQRLIDIHQKGLFNRKVSEVGFDKIQSINYHINGLQAAMLGYGDITVLTYSNDWTLPSVHHPEAVHEEMMAVARMVNSTPPQK